MSKFSVLLACCLAAVLSAQPFDATDDVGMVYHSDSVTGISIETDAGNIEVRAVEGDMIQLDVLRHAMGDEEELDLEAGEGSPLDRLIPIESELAGGHLTLNLEFPGDAEGWNASVVLSCPARTDLSLATGAGNISITGVTSGAEALTLAGYIRLTGTGGATEVETRAGEINIGSHSGSIAAVTGAGGITCVIDSIDERDVVNLETGAGGVTLRLPADISAHLDAATEQGIVTVTGFDVIWDVETEQAVVGTVLFGETEVTVRSGTGNISIGAR